MYARAASAYREVDLTSAPKAEILVRLFARCLDDIAKAKVAIAAKDIPAKAAAIDHASRIVCELRAALDHAAAPELAANLDALYRFVHDQLSTANLKLAPGPLDAATRVMSEIADAFSTARHRP
jgi:flagellar protein FliS